MKRSPVLILLIVCICALLAAGCATQSTPAQQPAAPAKSPGDTLFLQGEDAFNSNNFLAAADLFKLAQENYTAAGDKASALKARDMAFLAFGADGDFPYSRSAADGELAKALPDASASQRAAWLDEPDMATIRRNGEVLYFFDTVNNVRYHHPVLMQEENALAKRTPMYDDLMPVINAQWKDGTGPYGDPVAYTGSTELAIPRGELPATGMLKLWVPVPIETGSQTNVTIVSVEPARYVKSSTGTGADIGLVYLEIPLEEITDPFLNVTARYRFVQHEQRFVIDPAKVKPYDTGSPEYRKYTAPSGNIALTPEMKAKALAIVGNETNPYLRAQKIYWNTITTLPYSHAPHFTLDATGTPESLYVLTTGIGDCGSQSMYFTALCRSLGIPARATGGYQMIQGFAGTHFWAEYYLEGYGWIPVDVTAAEGGDWSYDATPAELQRYKEYFFGSLDPYRYIIQKDVDIPLTPGAGDAATPPVGWVQIPKAVCDTCGDNPMIQTITYSKVTVTRE
jgi:hypothetical protein